MIIQRLRDIQNRFGLLPDAELKELAKDSGVPLYRIEEISSYFPVFRLERTNPPDVLVRVCRDLTCHLRGAPALLDENQGLPATARELTTATGRKVGVRGVSCLGRCDRAPVVRVECWPAGANSTVRQFAGRTPEELHRVLRELATGGEAPGDPDASYQPHTNRRYALPVTEDTPAVPRGLAPIPVPGWLMDFYGHSNPRDYRAVRKFAQFLRERRKPLLPPPRELSGKELDDYVKKNHPELWKLKDADLLGMGGAGAPAYIKWLDVWRQPGDEKYIICNGNDSEPGTFKDRELLLRMPHVVVEGIILAGLMTGAAAGLIAIRHDHTEQIAAVREEVLSAFSLGAWGEDVFGSGCSFTLEVFEIPGGYVSGEQSALVEVMEDRRAQPRNRPPELTTNGLYDKPTVVNNVETLAWVPEIVMYGPDRYLRGWRASDPKVKFTGRRLFSVSGDVVRPGVFEVPVGLPLGDLLTGTNYCGGISGGRALKALAPSGPAGGFVPAKLPVDPKFDEKKRADAVARIAERSHQDAENMRWFLRAHLPLGAAELDVLALPLDLNFFRHLNAVLRLPVELMLGAGIFVCAEGTDILDLALNVTAFYQRETCGKCLPCRLGTQQLEALGTDLLTRRDAETLSAPDLRDTTSDVRDLARTLQLTSICGLGYVAPIPLASALAYFDADVRRKPN